MKNKFLFLFLLIFLASAVVSAYEYNNPSLPKIVTETTTQADINYSLVNVNNSLYWQGHTGTDGSWLTGISTFNSTYNNVLNQSCPTGKVVNGTLNNGTLICTTDIGMTSMNYTNIAMKNQSNNFTAGNQYINGSLYMAQDSGTANLPNREELTQKCRGSTLATILTCSAKSPEITLRDLKGNGEGYIDFYTYYLLPSTNQRVPTLRWRGVDVGGFTGRHEFWVSQGGSTDAPLSDIFNIDISGVDVTGDIDSTGSIFGNSLFGYAITSYGDITAGSTTWTPYLNINNLAGGTTRVSAIADARFFDTGSVWDYSQGYQMYNGGGAYTFGSTIDYKVYAVSSLGVFDVTPQTVSVYIDDQGAMENDNVVLEGGTLVGGDRFVLLRSTDGGVTYPDYFDTGTGQGGAFYVIDDGTIWTTGTVDVSNNQNHSTYINWNDAGGHTWGVNTINDIQVKSINATGNVVIGGNLSVKRPYGMFSSTQNQTVAVANTAYPMTFNWTEDNYLVYKSSDNANFSFSQTGDYLIELSIMAQGSQGDRAYIWVQKNGVNVPRSTTLYDFKGTGANTVIAVPFIIDMNTTDKFRVMYAGSATTVKFPYYLNTTFAPETPSTIMTITKISELT